MKELWKDIVIDGYDIRYQISNYGNVKSLARFTQQGHWIDEIMMRQHDNRKGYKYVDLYSGKKNGKCFKIRKYVHRLVAEYFVDNPNNYPEVDHIDINPSNNIYTNLRWCTHKGNYQNENTKKKERESHKGDRPTPEAIEKLCKKVSVYKDGELIHTFNSYKDLDLNSKTVIGQQLWNVYARQVARGERSQYKGFTFKIV